MSAIRKAAPAKFEPVPPAKKDSSKSRDEAAKKAKFASEAARREKEAK